MANRDSILRFRREVWDHYHAAGRHDLPWRKTRDPYKILVSEVMLQQTQVPRVLVKYAEFLAAFPDVRALARAPLSEVLQVWSGMGYNRRGKYLRDAAIAIVERHAGKVPHDAVSLRALPGIGSYTASAVLIFAFNVPDTFIETNVRTAFIHAFFQNPQPNPQANYKGRSLVRISGLKKSNSSNSYPQNSPRTDLGKNKKISDRELLPLIAQAAEGQDPRTWHWALMDYGSNLKKLHKNPSRQSTHYKKQTRFEGSLRQVRGAILRSLRKEPLAEKTLVARCYLDIIKEKTNLSGRFSLPEKRFEEALAGLVKDQMIRKEKGKWQIA